MKGRTRFIFTILIFFLLAASCQQKQISGSTRIFVSILPQKYFLERIAGDRFQVEVLVRPGESPATYSPTPAQMTGLSEAPLYFRIGVPFEKAWLSKIQNMNPQMKIIDTRLNIELREMDDFSRISQDYREQHQGEFIEHSVPDDYYRHNKFDYKHDHSHGMPDPHIWLSPALVKIQAETICNALIEYDHDNKEFYRANLIAFHEDLDSLSAEIRQALKNLDNRKFLVFHPSWGYFAHEFGLEQIPFEIQGKAPGMKMISDLIHFAKIEELKVIFVQEQFSQHEANAVAEILEADIVSIDPLSENYLENLRSVASVMERKLSGKDQ